MGERKEKNRDKSKDIYREREKWFCVLVYAFYLSVNGGKKKLDEARYLCV